jgi:hypothetical protein
VGLERGSGGHRYVVQSIGEANRLSLKAGDSVLFRGGQRYRGTLLLTGVEGVKGRPVWVGCDGSGSSGGGAGAGGSAVIDGGSAVIDGGDSSAVIVYRSRGVVLHGLRLTGAGRKTGNAKDGLAVIESKDVRVEDVDITGFQKSGLFIYASARVVASGVFAHENGAAGIGVEGPFDGKKGCRDLQFLDCRADDNPGDPTNLTNHSGNGIVVGHCTNVLIDRCSATNNGWDMPRIGNGPVGIWCYEADSVTIQHCLAYRNKTSPGAADGGGFDLDGGVTNSVIQYCRSYENQGAGYCIFQYWGASAWHGNIVRWNISEDDGLVSDGRGGIYVWNSSGDSALFFDCRVYGNTVYNSREAAISYSTTSARYGFVWKDNVFVGADSLIKGDKGRDLFAGNVWWVLGAADGRSGKAGDAGLPGRFVKPKFKSIKLN